MIVKSFVRLRVRGNKNCTRARLQIASGLLLAISSMTATSASIAGDLDKIIAFDIEAKTLDRALLQFGAQAHVQISFAWDSSTARIPTRTIKGQCAARTALANLLRGTRLSYVERGKTVEVLRIGVVHVAHKQHQTEGADKGSNYAQDKNDPPAATSRPLKKATTPRGAALQEIVVTGTRIAGETPVGVRIQTIDREQIQESGYTTLDQLLQSLPDNFRGGTAGASPDSIFSRGADRGFNNTFGSGVNLRGLGNDATLVLVNGHRIAPSGSGFFTDISIIPLSAIDHIDVLTDGSSAIYGSDAIAGVVNVILNQQSEGFDSGARYAAGNGFSIYDGTLGFGREGSKGGFTLNADYSGQGSLDVHDRPFTASIPSPTSIFPMSHQVWLSGAGHRLVANRILLDGDVEYSDTRRLWTGTYGVPPAQTLIDVPRWNGAVDARYQVSSTWSVVLGASVGEGTEKTMSNEFLKAGGSKFEDGIRTVSRVLDSGLHTAGELFSLPAGAVRTSLGASYLVQSYSDLNLNAQTVQRIGARRHVASGYAEVWVPVVSDANQIVGIHSLTISGADRYDRYSDFGGTNNYKGGVSWYPVRAIQFRGAYSTSFRAPAVGQELVDSKIGTTGVLLYPVLNPRRSAYIPVLFANGGQPNLKPETATNLTMGVDVSPSVVPRLQLSLDYYHIRYVNQLASAPFSVTGLSNPALAPAITEYPDSAPIESFVASVLANGGNFNNATRGLFGPNPLASTVYLYDLRLENLSRTDTSGADATIRYPIGFGSNVIDTHVEAAYIRDFFTQLTSTAPSVNEVSTVGYPAHLRITAQSAWHRDKLEFAVSGSYVGGYPDTSGSTPRRVGSYTVVNMEAQYGITQGVLGLRSGAITLAVTNLFNRYPPYVESGALGLVGSHYDAANASPIGRLVSVSLTAQW